jgi:N-methylhydantoinase A/oxoprolinase/acetone carboxylase beta subunit
MPHSPYVLGIDIGGSFTDSIALNTTTGEIRTAKASTTHRRFVEGIERSVEALGIELSNVARIVHGSTICTNALIEGKYARTGFIGTKGFSDEFDIQRMVRRWGKTAWSSIYDLHQKKPAAFNALIDEAQHTAEKYGVHDYVEPDLLVTDLFAESITRGKTVILIYKSPETLAAYQQLKADKTRLVKEGHYQGASRVDIARRFGRLLSYPDEEINHLLRDPQREA